MSCVSNATVFVYYSIVSEIETLGGGDYVS